MQKHVIMGNPYPTPTTLETVPVATPEEIAAGFGSSPATGSGKCEEKAHDGTPCRSRARVLWTMCNESKKLCHYHAGMVSHVGTFAELSPNAKLCEPAPEDVR